jgi:hypothetical protein
MALILDFELTWHNCLPHQDVSQVTLILSLFHNTFLQCLRTLFGGIGHFCVTALVFEKLADYSDTFLVKNRLSSYLGTTILRTKLESR